MNAFWIAAAVGTAIVLNLGCTSSNERKTAVRRPPQPQRHLPIDQVPMYAGLDRRAVPALKEADDWFISQAAAQFGGREKAAMTWVEQGFRFYKEDDLDSAMKQFNQAWLLDPNNPHVYWGFGSVLHNRGKAHDSYDMLARAHTLGLRDSGFLADLGRIAALRVVENQDDSQQRAKFKAESERFYAQAAQSGTNLVYIYESWALARYALEDFAGAWEKVAEARRHGGQTSPKLLELLSSQMPEPQ